MGWFLQVLVLVLLVLVGPSTPSICDYIQCNCTVVANKWINAVCAFNSTQRQLDITPDTMPRNLAELEISGPREMVLLTGSFSRNLTGLYAIRLAEVGALTVERRAFARLAHPHLRLEIIGAQRVIFESSAFHDLKVATISVSLERVEHLVVQEHSFHRLLALDIRHVGLLELQPNAFFYKPDRNESQGPATKILLDRVNVTDLPYNVFPSLNLLSITNSKVGVVRTSAFHALILTTVKITNTTISEVETEAFATRSAITLLELDSVVVGRLQPNSVQSGISRLVVRGSSLSDITESAFHMAVATVSLTENMFDHVRSRGFTLKETTSLTVVNNRFNILDETTFILPEGIAGQMINVTFISNSLGKDIGRGTLDFGRNKQIISYVNNNGFDYQCQCEGDTKAWLKEKINGSDRMIDVFYETSLCHINAYLSRCFSLPPGMFMMENFTELVCDLDGQYNCPEIEQSDAAIPSFPETTSDIVLEHTTERERKLLGSIFIFVISGVILMLFFSGFMWLRHNGYCTKARLFLFPSTDSMLNIISRVFVGPTATSSSGPVVNRTSVHEYAELQQTKQVEEDEISLEDKATQTLPEELTQELLQTLREKLDDPENYSEARDMIEHLYDLIKVEESCNQNSDFISLQLEELEDVREGENVYDVIQPKTKIKTKIPRVKKSLVSVGTRAPSPDKLLPLSLSRRPPAVLSEYMEPRDREQHFYQELPEVRPSVLNDYMEPPDTKPHYYVELPAAIANRPLPNKPDQKASDPGEGTSSH